MLSTYFFVNLFRNIQFLFFLKWPHMILASFYTHVCPSQLFFHCLKKLKNQRYPFEEDASMCGLCIFKKFLDVYFLPWGFFFELFWTNFMCNFLENSSDKLSVQHFWSAWILYYATTVMNGCAQLVLYKPFIVSVKKEN